MTRRTFQLGAILAASMVAVSLMALPAQAATGKHHANADPTLLASSLPKTVVIDIKTGKIQSVKAGATETPGPLISNVNYCQSSDACYYSGQVPYADQGFFGTNGTKTGSWPYRSGGYSGVYYVKFCWNGGTCGPVLSPYTTFFYGGGARATGTSVTISGRAS